MSPTTRRAAGVGLATLLLADLARRLFVGVPPDISAYLAAADVYASGGNPYTEALFAARRSRGYPFVYVPGVLPLIEGLHSLPARLVAFGDLAARAGVWVAVARSLSDRFGLDVETPVAAAFGVAFLPLVDDAVAGNLATYLLGGLLFVEWYTRSDVSPDRPWGGLVPIVGLGAAFKPMWLLPIGWVVVSRRHWRGAAAVASGVAVVAAGTWLEWWLVGDWLERLSAVRRHYRSVDVFALAPAASPVVLAGWLGVGAWLQRTNSGETAPLWLWGCASLLAWPRLATYSYAVLGPVLVYFASRFERGRFAAVAVPVLLPVGWFVRTTAGGYTLRVVLFGWGLLVTLLLGRALAGEGTE